MTRTTHLNSLQALEMALREGSFRAAADQLGITPAAVGQRIRALETFLGTDLILRGRSGLQPTAALSAALPDLQAGFRRLDRVAEALDFQRTAEIHIVADPDWSELWLVPRLETFRAAFPNIQFNVNGQGDVPMRLGAADIFIDRDPEGRAAGGEALFHEAFLPVGSPENVGRFADPFSVKADDPAPRYLPVGTLSDSQRTWRHSEIGSLEGFPLLHVQPALSALAVPGWVEWLERYPYERTAPDRGVRYAHVRGALDAARSNVGMLVSGLAYILDELGAGTLGLPFPVSECLLAEHPYRLRLREDARGRPQIARFVEWLKSECTTLEARMEALMLA